MIKRLNNKGNTLAIVLIGIFILSILGTLILGITSTNYNMKLNDKKTEMVFYYAEKAADEVYAGIGNEVMTCIKQSYIEVLENTVSGSASTGYTDLTSDEAKEKFGNLYVEGKTNAYDITKYDIKGLKVLYPKPGEEITGYERDEMFNRLQTYITTVSGYDISVKDIISGTNETKIDYIYKKDPTTGVDTGELEKIELKNVCIECKATSTGNYVNLLTDFTIKIPDVSLDFSDTKSSMDLKNLFSYALIAQGVNANDPVISVGSSITANVIGNIYSGSSAIGGASKVNSTTSILVNNGSILNCNSKVVYCEGRFVLEDGTADLSSKDDSGNTYDIYKDKTLQFYAKNISTEDSGSTQGAKLTVSGNTVVEDDLEINDDNSNIIMNGAYYGYSFRDANNDNMEDDSNSTVADFTSITTATTREHFNSSAIIVNGKNANVNLNGLQQLILAGRAYIDLDQNAGINTSYMTGESISFKGNQVMYEADTELEGATISLASGIKCSTITSGLNKPLGSTFTYAELGIDSNKVIGKEINSKMYFYKKVTSPVTQTATFIDSFNYDSVKRAKLQEEARALNVTLNYNNSAKLYTVGTILEVENGVFSSWATNGGTITTERTTDGDLGFRNILSDIEKRKGYLVPTLENVDEAGEKFLGYSLVNAPDSVSATTPYDYYLSSDFISGTVAIDKNIRIDNDITYTGVNDQIRTAMGVVDVADPVFANKKIGYIVSNSISSTGGTDSTISIGTDAGDIDLDIGVIITTKPVKIKQDFVGIVITGDSIEILGNAEISANEKVAEILFENLSDLTSVINPALGVTEEDNDDVVKFGSGLSYEDLVEKSNWRKNIVN